ncbi:MAG: hypothetical protein ACRDZP_05745, partial [Acidimicrobiales bacterium]
MRNGLIAGAAGALTLGTLLVPLASGTPYADRPSSRPAPVHLVDRVVSASTHKLSTRTVAKLAVPNSPTLFGASVWENKGETFQGALAREDSQFGRMDIVRIYYPGLPK